MAGITNSVRKVAKINPPMTATPIDIRLSDPAPRAKAMGNIPNMVERLVMSIGRNLALAAPMIASVSDSSCAFL